MTLFVDSEFKPEERSSPEEDDEDQDVAEVGSEGYENEDNSADGSEIDEIGQEVEEGSDQYGEEELDEQEVQEDSSDAEEEEDDSEDAGEVEEGNDEEDEIEDVEDPESIFNRIAVLDESMFGDITFNNLALFAITEPVDEIRKQVNVKTTNKATNKEISEKMTALARTNDFVDGLSELSKITEFVFHLHKVYSVKLNLQGSDKNESLLVELISSALRKFMRFVPIRRSLLLTLSIQFISASSGRKLQRLLCRRRGNTYKIHNFWITFWTGRNR